MNSSRVDAARQKAIPNRCIPLDLHYDIREARQAKTPLTDEQKQALKGKEKSIPHAPEAGKWHELLVQVEGDTLSVSRNGQSIGSHRSPGIAHPTQRLLRLAVPRNAIVDDVKIYRKK